MGAYRLGFAEEEEKERNDEQTCIHGCLPRIGPRVILAACSAAATPTPAPATPVPATATAVPPTPTATPTRAAPTATPTVPPTPTATPVPTATPTPRYSGARGANVVTEWNAVAEGVATTNIATDAITMALMHIAIHDALNSIDPRYEPFVVETSVPGVSPEAAVASAAHTLLFARLPASARPTLAAALASSLATIPDGPAKTQGIQLGKAVGQTVFAFYNPVAVPGLPVPKPGPGVWSAPAGTTTLNGNFPPAFPALTFTNVEQFRAPPPVSLTSAEYTADFNESKAIGSVNSAVRTPEQTAIANFWQPAGVSLNWNQAARQLSVAQQLDLWDAARLSAVITVVAADRARALLDTQAFYARWRPQQAIREGESDGNPDTIGDPTWTALDPTLANPDYVSGHGATCEGMSYALQTLTRVNQLNFTIKIGTVTRTYSSLSAAAEECENSRIWGGSHFRKSMEAGVAQGHKLAVHVVTNFFRPLLPTPPQDRRHGSPPNGPPIKDLP